MAESDFLVDPTTAATTVSLSAVGGWLILRLLKSFSGRIKDEDDRVRKQELENETNRAKILELEKGGARCETENTFLRGQLAEAVERIKALEMRELG